MIPDFLMCPHTDPRHAPHGRALIAPICLGLGMLAPLSADDLLENQPLSPPSRSQNADLTTLFEKIPPKQSGLDYLPPSELRENYEMHITSYASTAGVGIADYDSDGRPDIFLSNMNDGGKLFRNLGDFRFEDVTEKAGLDLKGMWGTGVTFADIDNDGHVDLAVCGFDCPNRIYLNRGDGTFVERAKELGLDFSGASSSLSFIDLDRDGDLDAYLATNSLTNFGSEKGGKGKVVDGKVVLDPGFEELAYVMYLPNGQFKIVPAGQFDHCYRNDGGTFTEISEEVGIHGPNHHGLSASWWDYNGDLWPDLYVSNDFHGPDHLYEHNGNAENPAFIDRIKSAVPHVPWYSMGTDFGDINNDGHLDFMGADMSPSSHYRSKLTMGDMTPNAWFLDLADPPQYMRNILLVNTGMGSFLESAQLSGLSNTDWTWSVRMADLDCDSLLDVYLTTGMTRDFMNTDLATEVDKIKAAFPRTADGASQRRAQAAFWENKPAMKQKNLAFRNKGDLKFQDIGARWGLDELSVGFGAASADLDGDGDLDLVVSNYRQEPSLFRNHIGSGENTTANRIKIRLRGTSSNSHGIGAMVRLQSDAGQQVRYLTLTRGYMSSSEPLLFFGLGEDDKIHSLSIEWPSGHRQEFQNLEVNQAYTLTEPKGDASPSSPSPTTPTLLTATPNLDHITHQDEPYDDFAVQPLLPNKLSQLGPGLAWADVDGDGRDDLYLSGATGQPGQLLFREDNGFQIRPKASTALISDRMHEDMAPLFLDVDSDGDQDLYVVSGGVECPANSPALRDRLYLNDGKGNLSPAPQGALPNVYDSGSTAVAADYDRDGDLDIFVGGRVVPGAYPSTPMSRLLRNDSTPGSSPRFTDATTDDASDLLTTGLVTSALWTDTNNDGWLDLVVTHEWGPVKIFRNHEGTLRDETIAAGLSDRLGWYNGIAGGDVDHDGDIDLVVTNFGRNTKYHPKADAPVHIYYGDFDGTGIKQVVEAKESKDALLPTRGKSCSQNAMPFLRKKCPTYESFASKSLIEIYTPEKLDKAVQLTANNLDSGLLLNQGDGSFEFRALPTLAQISPGFGLTLTDLDADSHLDIVIAQNFFGPQRETGRMDGGVGAVLRGNGNGEFQELWPDLAGLNHSEDATALTITNLNDDQTPDFVIANNDGPLRSYLGTPPQNGDRHVSITLIAASGNPSAIGSQVTLTLSDGTIRTAESYAGGGYLSQSAPLLTFGLKADQQIKRIDVRWPDGRNSQQMAPDQKKILIKQDL